MNYVILLIAGVIITTAILVITYTWLFARFFCKPKRYKTKNSPLSYGLHADLVEFKSQGKRLEGWLIGKNSQTKFKPLVIFAHGWSANSSLLLPFAKFLYKLGFKVFMYDCRGHGNSEKDGPITIRKMALDISAAIDCIYKKFETENLSLSVFGHSMGASAALLAASNDSRIEKIIACAPFSDPETLIRRNVKSKKIPMGIFIHFVFYFMQKWLGTTMRDVSPVNRIKRIEKDILLIHGANDQLIPYSDILSLQKASDPKRLTFLNIEKRGHFDILRDSLFMNNVANFIEGSRLSKT